MRGAPALGPSQHHLAPASSHPAPPADAQACREGTKGRNGWWPAVRPSLPLATYPQQRVPAVTLGERMCVLSPKLWGRMGSLSQVSGRRQEGHLGGCIQAWGRVT